MIGFGLVGAWVCLPAFDSGTGGGSVRGEAALGKSEQSLDSTANPSGAPGGAVDLSMDGTGPYKKHDGPIMSSLYSAPGAAEAAASTSTLTMAKADTKLADQLKMVARKSAAAPAAAPAAAAAASFNAPHAGFGSMGGLPGGSGSGASASAAGGGSSFFGGSQANVGVSQAQGLKGSVDADKVPVSGMKALQSAAQASVAAAKSGSFDQSAAMSGSAFDGRSGGGSINDQGSGGGNGVTLGSLDAAPTIPTVDDPFANKKLDNSNVPHSATSNTDKNAAMKQMIMMMVGTMVIGGLMGASMSSMVPMMGMMAMQMAMTNQQADAQAIQQQKNIGGH